MLFVWWPDSNITMVGAFSYGKFPSSVTPPRVLFLYTDLHLVSVNNWTFWGFRLSAGIDLTKLALALFLHKRCLLRAFAKGARPMMPLPFASILHYLDTQVQIDVYLRYFYFISPPTLSFSFIKNFCFVLRIIISLKIWIPVNAKQAYPEWILPTRIALTL